MSYRFTAPAALALVITTLPAGAQDFRYAPGTATYRASVVTRMSRAAGAQRMEDELTQTQRLTIALAPQRGDTLRIGITIDSASIASRAAGAQDVSQLVGLKVDGRISPLGAVLARATTSRDLGPAGSVVANELTRFLPRMRKDLRPGLTWTDTTSEQVDMLGVPVQRRTVTTSTVARDTTVHGERAWRVNRTAVVSFSGQGSVSGRPLTLKGASTSAGHIVVTRSGKYAGSSQTDTVNTSFEVPGTGMQVGITQSQVTRVALVR